MKPYERSTSDDARKDDGSTEKLEMDLNNHRINDLPEV